MTDGLKDRHRDAIIALLAANDRVEKAVLFGSRAMQTGTDTSDVDIALFGDKLSLTDQARLTAAIDEIPMAQSVDLVLHRTIDHQPLIDHIRTHGVEWYRKPDNNKADSRLYLRPEHRRTLEALLREHLPDVEVWAYGDRVNGRSQDHDGIDLALRGPGLKEIPASRLTDFEDAVRESTIPFLVEARDWALLPERFQREIEREYVVLVGTDGLRSSGSQWAVATIEDISEKVAMGPFGSSIKVETFVPNGIPIISGQHLRGSRVDDTPGFNFITPEHAERLANANVFRGDIVFTHRGNIGQSAYVPKNSKYSRYVVSQSQFYLRCDHSKALPEFVTLFFKSPEGQHKLLANTSQVGVPSIAKPVSYLRTIEIPLPPLPEQRAIAHILGTLDDKIESNRRMNATLEAMARAIFKDWFVDFGPTRAKMEGRSPYLPTDLWNLFPEALDDEGKPIGWTISEIGREVQAVGGGTPSTKETSYWDGGEHHWATPKDLSKLTSPVLLATDRKITDAGVTKISSGLLPTGTVLLSSRAPIGYLAITEVPTAVNQGFIAMVCRKGLPNTFVLFWCKENLDYIKGISGGSTFAEISKGVFRSIPIILPSEKILAAYHRLIHPLFVRIASTVKEVETLARSRDRLLPKLVSGEIRVRDAEKALEAVA